MVWEEIIRQYDFLKGYTGLTPFGEGHINDTYLVETHGESYILQRVNRQVFDIPVLVSNLEFFFSALSGYQKKTGVKLTPAVYKNRSGKYHCIDQEGAAWRVMEFFPGCSSYAVSQDTGISYKAAKAMGRFQLFLNTLPVHRFGYTIQGFHNTAGRYETFLKTLKRADGKRKEKAKEEINFVLNNSDIACEVNRLIENDNLPERVTHNDTKLDNILFPEQGDALIIDLDTVMPGYVMYDYGDMVRTFTGPVKEDEPEAEKMQFRIDHFRALTDGYLEGLNGSLKETERKSLITGTKAIIYEQVIRFLNDFLLGNIYYKVKYPEHNLTRTRTQIMLLKGVLANEALLSEYVERVGRG